MARSRALAEARTIDEVKHVRDRAEALRLYSKQAGESLEMQNAIAEIKLRAERRAAELLAELPRGRAGRPGRNSSQPATNFEDALRELEIPRSTAYRWQAEATVPEDVFEQYIAEVKAEGQELTSAGLLTLAKALQKQTQRDQRRTAALEEAITGKFPVLYADPPWIYRNVGLNGAASNHYPTMTTEAICSLPVVGLTTANAVLFLWAPPPHLECALQVMKAWGFAYKTSLSWTKDRIGTGFYFRAQHELLLLGVKGVGICPDEARRPPSVLNAPRGRHSEKPQGMYDLIEFMYPGLPKLELFARRRRNGWHAWGMRCRRAEA